MLQPLRKVVVFTFWNGWRSRTCALVDKLYVFLDKRAVSVDFAPTPASNVFLILW